jgi:hypothetical protein
MDTFVAAAGLLALIKKFVDFSKYVTNRDWNGALTQIYVWGAGIIAVFLYANTDWAHSIAFGGLTLADMNAGSLVALGLALGSGGSLTTDFIKSRDSSDSAAMPALIKED